MQMVWHYDKVVKPEFPGRYVGAKHVDHQRGIPLRLQQGAALAGLGGGAERTRRDLLSLPRRRCISWSVRRSEARRSSTWHSVPTATGRGVGWSWWWRRTYALNSGCCPEEHCEQVLPSPGAKAPFLSRFGTAEAMP